MEEKRWVEVFTVVGSCRHVETFIFYTTNKSSWVFCVTLYKACKLFLTTPGRHEACSESLGEHGFEPTDCAFLNGLRPSSQNEQITLPTPLNLWPKQSFLQEKQKFPSLLWNTLHGSQSVSCNCRKTLKLLPKIQGNTVFTPRSVFFLTIFDTRPKMST